jgi:hypothetical protein
VRKLVPALVVVRSWVQASEVVHRCVLVVVSVVVGVTLARLLDSIEGTRPSPHKPWSHRDKWICHTDYRQIPRVGSGDRSIGLVLKLSLDRPY